MGICCALALAGLNAQSTDLEATLRRAGAYVVGFEQQLAGIVAEETYTQDAIPVGEHVELKSDLLVVKPVGGDRYVGFRDVFEVNRRPVHDRQDRLFTLFLSPDASTGQQARAIAEESSRFNVGHIDRNVNVPTFALMILEPQNQRRFRFKLTGNRRPELAETQPREDVAVEFEEKEHPTLVRNTAGKDAPSRGRFWVVPASGRIDATELIVDVPGDRVDATITAVIDVTYGTAPGIPLPVPLDMRERYQYNRRAESRPTEQIEGVASYAHFRQFQVKVDEKIAPIKQ